MSLIARLRRTSPEELRWRAAALARIHLDRIRALTRQPAWRREAITDVLSPELASVLRADVVAGRWPQVHARLLEQLRQRPARFVLDPSDAVGMRAAILERWPGAADEAAARAGHLLNGRYDLLGYRALCFDRAGEAPDWHYDPVHQRRAPVRFWADVPYLDPAYGDHKIIWELNRHQHWLALGRALWLTRDARFRRAILHQLESWLAANPPLLGINWASMLEIGFRSISWIWALHVLLGDAASRDTAADAESPWLVDLFVALDRQLQHVEQNLSYYFSPNTHLTGEALALYVAGRALPELAAAARWAATGRSILLREIDRQIAPDGGHAERSTHYHRYTLDFYLLALQMARQTGDAAAASFEDAATRLATFMHAMADDVGRIPLIGDDDGGMLWPFRGPDHADVRPSLAMAAVILDRPELAPWPLPEETYWLAWPAATRLEGESRPAKAPPPTPRNTAMAFADTGYVVMRDERGSHLVFDVGPHGYLNGGHAHADALAITLSLAGRPLLIDPGTATYTMNPPLRDRLRRSSSHNTVTLNGRSSAEPAGPFHWAARADATLVACRSNPRFGWAEGTHDGYTGVLPRRHVVAWADGWFVADTIAGSGGPHHAEAHWHFDPSWEVEVFGQAIRAQHPDTPAAWLVHAVGDLRVERGRTDGAVGWCSGSYGTLQPTWSARVGASGPAPLTILTWIGPARTLEAPTLAAEGTDGDRDSQALAMRLVDGPIEAFVMMRSGEPAARANRLCSVRSYRTDARLLCLTLEEGRVVALAIADATTADAMRPDWPSIHGDGWIPDLYLSVEHQGLSIWTSAMPRRLEVRGAMLSRVARVRLNGGEAAVERAGPDRLVVCGTGGTAIAAPTRDVRRAPLLVLPGG